MDRRDFIKIIPASMIFAASCSKPEKHFAPNVEDMLSGYPGEKLLAQTVYADGADVIPSIAVMVDGRPVRIYGKNGSTVKLESSIYELYDKSRIYKPTINEKEVEIDEAIETVKSLINNSYNINILNSPTLMPAFNDILLKIKEIRPQVRYFDSTETIFQEDEILINTISSKQISIEKQIRQIQINHRNTEIIFPLSHDLENSFDYYSNGKVYISQRLIKYLNDDSISIPDFFLRVFEPADIQSYDTYLIDKYGDKAVPGKSFEYSYNQSEIKIVRNFPNPIEREIDILHPDKIEKSDDELFKKIRLNGQFLSSYGFVRADYKKLSDLNYQYMGKHWAMAIDIDKCSGCGACIAACMIENNQPPVGRANLLQNKDMHWIRIEKYQIKYVPIMCQHCDVAPCESVCPVTATSHSSEGLNEMTYNRCVGTRYCMAACPYKVRRFNYEDYWSKQNLNELMHNPSVTKRMRGIVEKCTFCVHKLQNDDEITACQQACPEHAIVFGDLNDKNSKLYELAYSGNAMWLEGGDEYIPSVFYISQNIDELINE